MSVSTIDNEMVIPKSDDTKGIISGYCLLARRIPIKHDQKL